MRIRLTDREHRDYLRRRERRLREMGPLGRFFLGDGIAWACVGGLAACVFLLLVLGVRWNVVWDRVLNGPHDLRFFH